MCADQTADQRVFELESPSKLNLGLKMVGRRDDGYHLLQSLFVPLSQFGDRLQVQRGPTQVTAEWATDAPRKEPDLPPAENNLITHFLRRLPRELGQWNVHLIKRVPLGAGLGGGSGNVGTLAQWMVGKFPKHGEAIREAALGLGSDVGFFLSPQPQWVEGVGDKVSPWEGTIPAWSVVLVFPPFPCETPEMYRRFREGGQPFSEAIEKPRDLVSYLNSCKNDLERIIEEAPLQNVLKSLRGTRPIHAGMSGSGSTCYAIYPSRQAAQNSLKALKDSFRSTQCKSVTLQM